MIEYGPDRLLPLVGQRQPRLLECGALPRSLEQDHVIPVCCKERGARVPFLDKGVEPAMDDERAEGLFLLCGKAECGKVCPLVRDPVPLERLVRCRVGIESIGEPVIEHLLVGIGREDEEFRGPVQERCCHPFAFGSSLFCQSGHHVLPVIEVVDLFCCILYRPEGNISQRVPAVELVVDDLHGMEGMVAHRKYKLLHGSLLTISMGAVGLQSLFQTCPKPHEAIGIALKCRAGSIEDRFF